MRWSERFKKIGKQKEDEEKRRLEEEKKREKRQQKEREQIIQNFSPRIQKVCREFAKAMKWVYTGFPSMLICEIRTGPGSNEQISVEIEDPETVSSWIHNGFPNYCIAFESNFLFNGAKEKIRKRYVRFIYPIQGTG